MSNRNYNNSTGIGFIGMLQIAFIVLKLMNVLTWSWLWILSPMWISFVLIVLMTILLVYFFDR